MTARAKRAMPTAPSGGRHGWRAHRTRHHQHGARRKVTATGRPVTHASLVLWPPGHRHAAGRPHPPAPMQARGREAKDSAPRPSNQHRRASLRAPRLLCLEVIVQSFALCVAAPVMGPAQRKVPRGACPSRHLTKAEFTAPRQHDDDVAAPAHDARLAATHPRLRLPSRLPHATLSRGAASLGS